MDPWHRDLSEAQAMALAEAMQAAGNVARLGIVVLALDGDPPELLYASDGSARLLGVAPDELKRSGITTSAGAAFLDALAEVKASGGVPASAQFETTLQSKGGQTLPVEVAAYFTKCLNRPVAICYLTDLSEQQATIAALADSEARFRTLVEGAPDGIAIVIDGRLSFANPAATRLLGASRAEEVVGKSFGELLEPVDAQRADQRIQRILQTQQRLGDPAEYKSRSVAGQVIYVEISSIPIEWKGRRAVLAFARDVTERKAMHSRLLHKDRLATVGALSAGLAHEVNNPLSYVLLNLQYIERELERRFGPRHLWQALSDRLQDAVHGAERVAAIVRDLKAFSRTDNGNHEPVDLARVVESAIRVAQNTVEHNATLQRDIRPVRAVLCSPQRIEQVVLNLLINATQSIEHGDVAKDKISVRVFEDGAHAVLEVSDTGRGMAEQERRRIFEPFFTTKPAGIGTGLGLSICRNIVEAAGGSISVRSEPAQGSTFSVRLPITQQLAFYPPPPAGDVASTQKTPPPRLLLIETSTLSQSIRHAFEDYYDVISTTGVEEAVRLLETGARFELVVCDVDRDANLPELVELQNKFGAMRQRLVLVTDGTLSDEARELLDRERIAHAERPLSKTAARQLLNQRGTLG